MFDSNTALRRKVRPLATINKAQGRDTCLLPCQTLTGEIGGGYSDTCPLLRALVLADMALLMQWRVVYMKILDILVMINQILGCRRLPREFPFVKVLVMYKILGRQMYQ